jgi:glutamine amidotransferase
MRIVVVSAGIGNVSSVSNMLRSIGFDVLLSDHPPRDDTPEVVFMPGVGSFDDGVKSLKNSGWYAWLRETSRDSSRNPCIVGICLGMQLLCDGSEEGNAEGLGLIPGYFRRFAFSDEKDLHLKVPHMGWNTVEFDRREAPWTSQLPDACRFYFVHSYKYTHSNDEFVVGRADYGGPFAAALQKGRIIGFQFHPEKSHRFGKALLNAVLKRKCSALE